MEWYHVRWPWLTSKRVAWLRFVSDSWVSCTGLICTGMHHFHSFFAQKFPPRTAERNLLRHALGLFWETRLLSPCHFPKRAGAYGRNYRLRRPCNAGADPAAQTRCLGLYISGLICNFLLLSRWSKWLALLRPGAKIAQLHDSLTIA